MQRKLQRIAIQLCEETWGQPDLVLVGIAPRGAQLAGRLAELMKANTKSRLAVAELALDKDDPLHGPVSMNVESAKLAGKTVVLVDDVLMSGRTLMHAAAHVVKADPAKLTSVVLVDRRHRAYPIRADIVGLTLSTTLQQHISVELGRKDAVYIS